MERSGSFLRLVLCVLFFGSLVEGFDESVFPELIKIENANVQHVSKYGLRSKRSIDGVPSFAAIQTRVSGAGHDVTLQFRKKKTQWFPSAVYMDGFGSLAVYKPSNFNNECLMFYEDTDDHAHAMVDFCNTVDGGFKMIAELHIKGSQHIILPSGSANNGHTLYKTSVPLVNFKADYSLRKVRPIHDSINNDQLNTRNKRGTSGPYTVEIVFVVDYKLYQYWYDKTDTNSANRNTDALDLITKFYAFVAESVNQRYQNMQELDITVRLTSIYVIQDITQATFLTTAGDNVRPLMEAFGEWIANLKLLLPTFPKGDHYMLVTGKDVSFDGDVTTAGYANLEAMCQTSSYSIVEGSFNFLSATLMAHELAHSLGGFHDGESNACSSDDGFILASTNKIMTGSGQRNPWLFSSCSVTSMNSFINSLNTGDNCLTTLVSTTSVTAAGSPPGERYSPDQQCASIFGTGSELVRYNYLGGYQTICTAMSCTNKIITDVKPVIPADGTTCGNKQWCQNGVCIQSNDAPAADETCLFGDQTGEYTSGATCQSRINGDLSTCYNADFWKVCCTSCEAAKLNIAGCEFGDINECSTIRASHCYDSSILNVCCKTCNDFEKPTLPETCKYGDKNSNCALNFCQSNADLCCETCIDVTTTPPSVSSSAATITTVTTTRAPVEGTTEKQSDELPSWVIPVAAGGGGVVLLIVVIAVICCCRNANKSNKAREPKNNHHNNAGHNRAHHRDRQHRNNRQADKPRSHYDQPSYGHQLNGGQSNGNRNFYNDKSHLGNNYRGQPYSRY